MVQKIAARPQYPATLAGKLDSLLRVARDEADQRYTPERIARQCTMITGEKVSAAYIRSLRAGDRDAPRWQLIEAIAVVVGIPPSYFLSNLQGQAAEAKLQLLLAARDPHIERAIVLMASMTLEQRAASEEALQAIVLGGQPTPPPPALRIP